MTAETEAEFVERVEANAIIVGADLSRLFALARRGAAMQTVDHLDDGKTAILKAAGLHQTSAKILEQAARIEQLEAALRAWESAVRVDVLMEGPRYMGVSGGEGKRAWELTRATLGEKP